MLVAGQHVHQVDVTPVKPAEVVIPLVLPIAIAHLPVAWRLYAVPERPIVQDRKVEAAAVPGNEIRRVPFDAVEKAADDFGLSGLLVTEAPDLETVSRAQGH